LATVGFYRHFIKNFSLLAVPLSELLKKDITFKWTNSCQTSFDKLKLAMTTCPILKHPDFARECEIHCDASDFAVGSNLMQINDGILHHIAYHS
jgi:hypothetical protein